MTSGSTTSALALQDTCCAEYGNPLFYSPCNDFEAPHVLTCQADRGRFEGVFVHEESQSLCQQRRDVNEEMGNHQNPMLQASCLDPEPTKQ